MRYDQDRYQSLIKSAAFDCSFYKGTIQDLSKAQRPMTFAGTPTWGRIGCLPALKQNSTGDAATSGNVAPLVDVTGTFTVEAIVLGLLDGTDQLLLNWGVGGAGGFVFMRQSTFTRVNITLFTIAGAVARELSSPVGSVPMLKPMHCLMTSVTGGTAGLFWINGQPAAVTLAGAGLAANYVGTRPILAGGGNAGLQITALVRGWLGALSNDDVDALHGAAHELTGGLV